MLRIPFVSNLSIDITELDSVSYTYLWPCVPFDKKLPYLLYFQRLLLQMIWNNLVFVYRRLKCIAQLLHNFLFSKTENTLPKC